MEINAKVFKRKTGKSKGKWIARIEYYDRVAGKTRTMERQKDKRSDAIDERDRLVNEIKKSHGQIQIGERMTFEQLAVLCADRFFKQAVIVEGRKIEGLKSYRPVHSSLIVLKEFFHKRRIGSITRESLNEYRRWRLKTGSRKQADKPVKVATVNRELAAMRRMMRYAYSEGWITRDIFFNAKVIEVSAEMERTRQLTQAEETRLLAACNCDTVIEYQRTRFGKAETIQASVKLDNPHLKAIILLALDSGMRRGEILKLRWQDIDTEAGLINIQATHTKTARSRIAPLTERAKAELVRVREFTRGERPFPFEDFKRSWKTAKRIAGIDDLRFHDLRRTALTRYQHRYSVGLAVAGKIAGHSELNTTMKYYTSADAAIIRQLTEDMNTAHAGSPEADTRSELVN